MKVYDQSGDVNNKYKPNKHMMMKSQLLKIKAPFISDITKINNTLIDNAEDLDMAMPMYN